MYESADQVLAPLWLNNPDSLEILSQYMTLMTECGRTEQAKKLKLLLQRLTGVEPDTADEDDLEEEKRLPFAYFEAAFSLTDARRFELLGFALMALNRIKEAIKSFEDALKITTDFDTTLNLSVCYVLTREAARAKELTSKLASLAQDSDEIREVNHRQMVLKRLDSLSSKKTLSHQDWLYILYGGILLSSNEYKGQIRSLDRWQKFSAN